MPDIGSVIINFGTSLPSWLLLIFCLISVMIGYFQYTKDQNFSIFHRFLLFGLRVLSLLLLILVVSEPIIRSKTYDEIKNTISVYFDISSSNNSNLRAEDTLTILEDFFPKINETVVNFSFNIFGQEVQNIEDIAELRTTNTSFEITDLEDVHNHIKSSNAKMALVLTDGIHTTGIQPYFERIADKSIYSITFGDTTQRSAIAIEDVVIPDNVYADEAFPVRTIVDLKNISSESLNFKLYKKEADTFKLITDSTVSLNSGNERIAITKNLLATDNKKEVLVKIEVSSGDLITSRTNLIPLIDKELKIASIATSIHPDVASTRRIIGSTKSVLLSTSNYFNRIEAISALDTNAVLIVHASLFDIQAIAEKYPKTPLIGFIINDSQRNNASYALADVTFEKETSFSTKLGIPNKKLPPLRVPIPALTIADTSPLLYANIKEFRVDVPIILFKEGESKRIYLTSDNWYTWLNYPDEDIQNYAENFLLQLIDWVKTSKDQDKIKTLSWPKNWVVNKDYVLALTVLDEVGRNDKEAIIEYRILDDEQKEIQNGFTQANAEGINQLTTSFTNEGAYSIKLKATKNAIVIDSSTVNLYVEAINLEMEWKTAQPKVLSDWTSSTNGENLGYADSLYEHLRQFENIIANQGLDQISFSERIETFEVAKSYWWFVLLVLLLATEWFIRRTKNAL